MRLRKSSGLVLDLRMEEESGAVAGDSSRYGNDGAITGCKWVEQGMEFNGVDNVVRIPDSDSLSPTSAMTVVCWVKGAAQSEKVVLSHWDSLGDQRGFMLRCLINKINIIISDDGTYNVGHKKYYTSSIVTFNNTWSLIGFSFDAGTLKLFVNGIEDLNTTKSFDDAITTIHNSTADVTIGSRLSSGTPTNIFNGTIDEARIHNRALTLSEIRSYYDSTKHNYATFTGGTLISGPFYGVAWNESADTYSRTGILDGVACGSSPGNPSLPIQALMKRCVMDDAGIIQYYLDSSDSTKKEDGDPSNLVGGDGQVMVEIPAFYFRHNYSSNTHTWDISRTPLEGFSLHHAFVKNGSIVPHRYIGAYEGSMWDATTSAMVAPADIVTDMYASGDKLCSYSGEFPKTNEMRSEFRTMAAQRGTGWRQLDFDLNSAVQILYLIEYAEFDSQSMIGMGRTELSGGTWVADSYIGQCGKSNGDGDGTNSVAGNTNNAYMTYRGIENWYGNVWKFNDGININANVPYVTNNDSVWADDTSTGYDALGITLANTDGWQKTLEQTDRGFLPASAGGSSSTYVSDYYWQSTGWRVVGLGSSADHGARAGAFSVLAYYAASDGVVHVGGRLSF